MNFVKAFHDYLCICSVVMDYGTEAFTAGCVYDSDSSKDGEKLINNSGEDHRFTYTFFSKYFIDTADLPSPFYFNNIKVK